MAQLGTFTDKHRKKREPNLKAWEKTASWALLK